MSSFITSIESFTIISFRHVLGQSGHFIACVTVSGMWKVGVYVLNAYVPTGVRDPEEPAKFLLETIQPEGDHLVCKFVAVGKAIHPINVASLKKDGVTLTDDDDKSTTQTKIKVSFGW